MGVLRFDATDLKLFWTFLFSIKILSRIFFYSEQDNNVFQPENIPR